MTREEFESGLKRYPIIIGSATPDGNKSFVADALGYLQSQIDDLQKSKKNIETISL